MDLRSILPLPNVLCDYIETLSYGIIHREKLNNVAKELFFATHCHSCGKIYNVMLLGYVGEFCSKRCDHNPGEYMEEEYDQFQNRVCSKYHRNHYNRLSPTGVVWPMTTLPSTNEILKTKRTIIIKGYNDWNNIRE